MKTEVTYQWRIQWAGKWSTTRHHFTEEHIRKEHPEAVRLDGTRRELQLPETELEIAAAQRGCTTSVFLG